MTGEALSPLRRAILQEHLILRRFWLIGMPTAADLRALARSVARRLSVPVNAVQQELADLRIPSVD